MHFIQKQICVMIQISIKFVPNGPIDKSALVQVIA